MTNIINLLTPKQAARPLRGIFIIESETGFRVEVRMSYNVKKVEAASGITLAKAIDTAHDYRRQSTHLPIYLLHDKVGRPSDESYGRPPE